ncbi:hypothetical protein JOD82_001706 [Paenibacillus sp. 1182]|uniref:hypothetical protein n=1 Tax=Paenibacillus sp. 1182 TaxID=2806565 RepID=UPI001AE9E0FF|nr:hypothetical protein [Paenibacillus sp. 1182]MBP1308686.1 hypothetical protein [Paenibacillus sp. 1182]
MVTQQLKRDFKILLEAMTRAGLIKEGIIAMGNLAYFLDRCSTKPVNHRLKQAVAMQITSSDAQSKQELFLLLANNIYEQAKKEKRGENLDYRMERIIEKHAKRTLTHFEILLDDYDFPDWFKVYIPFLEAHEPQVACDLLMEVIQEKSSFSRLLKPYGYAEKISLYVHQAYRNSLRWKCMLPLIDAIIDEDFEETLSILHISLETV